MDTRRIEALADGVFAIAMTLLVLEIHVPMVPPPVSATALVQSLVALLPHVGGYAVSFVILATLWIGHHNHFHFIRRADRILLWINILYLACIAFLPFSTALLATYRDQPIAAMVYGGTLLLAGVLLYAHWRYATARRRLTDPDLPEAVVTAGARRIAAGFAVYLGATLAGFMSMPLSLALFAAMPVAYILPGRVDRHFDVRGR